MMRNMNPDTLSNMMNMVNQNPNLMQQAMQMSQNAGFPGMQNNNNYYLHEQKFLMEIENCKSKGNIHFKKEEFNTASLIYFESLIKIKEFRKNNKNIYLKNDLQILENKIRLNYGISKLKLGDFQKVIDSAKIVFENNQSGKSSYYLALGLFHKGDFKNALSYAKKSKAIELSLIHI